MLPEILKTKSPRNIQYSDDLFAKNRKKVNGIFIGALALIPVMAIIFWLKFDDFIPGLYWGAGIAAFFELFGVGLMMNAKSAVNICQNGLVVMGTVVKSNIAGNTGKYTTADSAGYIFVTVNYKENLGRELTGMASFIGASGEIDMKEGDQIPVVFLNEKPEKFILWSDSLGISTIGKAKDKK
jgi:hypothetical protein